jgi:hypothetical protein
MAWWIHDHLSYSSLCFFAKMGAFNIGWHERPVRQIDSYAKPKGYLTRPGMSNHGGTYAAEYEGLLASLRRPCVDSHHLPIPENQAVAAAPSVVAIAQASRVVDAVTHTKGEHADMPVNYRAVHTKSAWRIARGHKSLENAIYGKDGAAGLFARKVRIDYERHGAPLYVVVWQSGCSTGFVVTSSTTSPERIAVAKLPIAEIYAYEEQGGVSTEVLSRLF